MEQDLTGRRQSESCPTITADLGATSAFSTQVKQKLVPEGSLGPPGTLGTLFLFQIRSRKAKINPLF